MSILRTGIFAEFVLFSLCAVAPLTAAAQVSGAPPPVAEATLDFLPDQTDKCDALADYPGDPHRVGDGVAFERIGVVDALPVCEQAATRLPARPRYQYLYGRVLSAAQRYDEAARQFSMADQAGYALATYNIGNFYAEGMGVAQDRDKAASFAPSRYRDIIDWIGGTPAALPERYALLRGLSYAERIRQPVLLIQGTLDMVTPLDHALWMERALKEAGNAAVRVEMIPRMGHFCEQTGQGYLFDQVAALVIEWFTKTLR